MLATILAGHPWLAGALLAAVVALGLPIAWWLALRRRAARALAAATGGAILLLTLLPSPRDVEPGCAIEWDAPLTAPEPLANVVLFVPFSLLVGVSLGRAWEGTGAWRALLGAAAGLGAGVLLSALIETTQALVPAIGRSCSTGDWLANAVGAAIGGLLALAAVQLARASRRRAAARQRAAAGRR